MMNSMKLEKPQFEHLLYRLKPVPKIVHSRDARLFEGKTETSYGPFQEDIRDGSGKRIGAAYFLIYATIDGRTLPVETGIIPSLADTSKSECGGRGCGAIHAGLDAVIEKQLEVLAMPTEGKDGVRPKWEIILLRNGDDFGFVNDSVLAVLV
jgi:hypothetical protein